VVVRFGVSCPSKREEVQAAISRRIILNSERQRSPSPVGGSGAALFHKTCHGEVEPIPGHGLHCLKCDGGLLIAIEKVAEATKVRGIYP